MSETIQDGDLGLLAWEARLEWWEGSIKLESEQPFTLYLFARPRLVPDRSISDQAREAILWARDNEALCRRYAAETLLGVQQSEWSEGEVVTEEDFVRRLSPDALVVHESGYTEISFSDDGMFLGHAVGIRVRPGGELQEALLEG